MRANRMISILMMLIKRNGITAADLGKILGVSYRTIYRDMDEFKKAGVPIITAPGDYGKYRLSDEYKESLGLMNYEDVSSLLISLKNMKILNLETDNDVLLRRLKEFLSIDYTKLSSKESYVELEVRFNTQEKDSVLGFFGDNILKVIISEDGESHTANVAILDDKHHFDMLLAIADKCVFVAPEHICKYVTIKAHRASALHPLKEA